MGGNIFSNTTKIKKEDINTTVDKYFNELKTIFPKKEYLFNTTKMKYIGSVGKKPYSGDIDFAIDRKDIVNDFVESIHEWDLDFNVVMTTYKKLQKRSRTATDIELQTKAILIGIGQKINLHKKNIEVEIKKTNTGNMFSSFPQYRKKKLQKNVQIDWMVGELDLLMFSYYSKSYEGVTKGLHRTQLLLSIFNVYGYSFNHTKGLLNKETNHQTTNVDEILETLYSIVGEVDSYDYNELVKSLPIEKRDEVLNVYFRILSRTRCDIPENIQNDWVRLDKTENYETRFLPETSKLKVV